MFTAGAAACAQQRFIWRNVCFCSEEMRWPLTFVLRKSRLQNVLGCNPVDLIIPIEKKISIPLNF